MSENLFTKNELETISKDGLTVEALTSQLEILRVKRFHLNSTGPVQLATG